MMNKLLILFLLFVCTPAWSATELLVTVCPAGTNTCDDGTTGTASSLSGAISYIKTNYPNLVTADKYASVKISGTWSSADTTAVSISGITTDATHYINIFTSGNARHNGKASSISGRNNYRLIPTFSANGSVVSVSYNVITTIDGVEISAVTNNYQVNGIKISCSGASQLLSNNLIHDISSTSVSSGIYIDGSGRAWDNIIYNVSGNNSSACLLTTNQWSTGNIIANNTCYQSVNYSRGFSGAAGSSSTFKNNLATCPTTYSGYLLPTSGWTTISNNGSSNSDGQITNLVIADTFVSSSSGSEDLHLKGGSGAIDQGADLSSTFTTDIDGQTRSGTWDIGADEYVSGAQTVTNYILNDSVWNDAVFY